MLTTFNLLIDELTYMLTKNGVYTLANIIIVNPTCANLLPQFCTTQRFATSNVAQAKEMSYHNWHPTNQFFPLAIEIFWCLQKCVCVFLHNCAKAIWNLKRLDDFPLFVLVTYLRQKNSITFQRIQTSSILSQAMVVGLTISWLPPF